jgi:hypothetical protein
MQVCVSKLTPQILESVTSQWQLYQQILFLRFQVMTPGQCRPCSWEERVRVSLQLLKTGALWWKKWIPTQSTEQMKLLNGSEANSSMGQIALKKLVLPGWRLCEKPVHLTFEPHRIRHRLTTSTTNPKIIKANRFWKWMGLWTFENPQKTHFISYTARKNIKWFITDYNIYVKIIQ